jgi:hypothetical protein
MLEPEWAVVRRESSANQVYLQSGNTVAMGAGF